MPRRGPKRPLLAARVDHPHMEWIEERCESEAVNFPDFVRRVIAYAHLNMPEGWTPPEKDS